MGPRGIFLGFVTLGAALIACAQGIADDTRGAALPNGPATGTGDGESAKLPPPSSKGEEDAGKSSSGSGNGSSSNGSSGNGSSGNGSSSGGSSGSSSGGSSGSSSGGSSSSSGGSSSSTSSSSGGAAPDCDLNDPNKALLYYSAAIVALADPVPDECPCDPSKCCYSGLVCVAR